MQKIKSTKPIKRYIIVTLLIAIIGLTAITSYTVLKGQDIECYVGVTYCGSSVQEAKELIDKVKGYTNLFVLQSGSLQWNITAITEIGDYATALNLNYVIYSGTRNTGISNSWLSEAKQRWGEQFIGIYFNDEIGGNMLDNNVGLELCITQQGEGTSIYNRVFKSQIGEISFIDDDGTNYMYYPDGKVTCETRNYENSHISVFYTVTYYSDGTITVLEREIEYISDGILERNNFYTSENITEYPSSIQSYQQVLKKNPIQTHDDAAELFINMISESLKGKSMTSVSSLNKTQLNEESMLVFTSDYGLYWWDYQGGYDIVLAEIGWNHTITQDIGLIRGAATAQNKSWGTIITWKYDKAPYLPNGEEMFEQLKLSYETGAEYILIFNYSENPANPNTLQEEHFQTLERFWKNVVQNPKIKQGSIKAEAVLVLPQNYGWGMRNPYDTIWGIWPTDDRSEQIWNQLQNKLEKHGSKLDIIYENPNNPTKTDQYKNIYHWNQDS